MAAEQLITRHLDLWTAAIKRRSTAGRGSSSKIELYGIKKLRELILELAVRGLLVPQDPKDEPASELLKKIAAEKAKLVKAGKVKQGKALPTVSGDGQQAAPSGWSWTCMAELGEISPRNDVEDDVIASFVPMPLISTRFDGRHDHEPRPWAEIKKGYTHFADGDVAIAKITPCFENSKAAIFSGLSNGVGAGTTELHVVRPYGDGEFARIRKRCDPNIGDVLISCSGSVGRVALVDRNNAYAMVRSAAMVRPVFIRPGYLALCLRSPALQEQMVAKSRQSAQANLFLGAISSLLVALPPVQEQHRIVAKVDELMALCDQLKTRLSDAQATQLNLADALTEAAQAGA